jgi:PAS domain S-box-containing protein
VVSHVTRIAELRFGSFKALDARGLGQYALDLVVVGFSYFVLAKLGWMMALAVEPGAPPIRPATGLALAAVLLRGVRIWPAIFVSEWAASEQFGGTGSAFASATLAAVSTLEALIGGYLTTLWSSGRKTFDTAAGVAKFTLIAIGCSTVGGVIGIGRIGLIADSDWSAVLSSWAGWWACDAAGALVVAPPIVLWANEIRSFSPKAWFGKVRFQEILVAGTALVGAGVIGVVAFSPLIPDSADRSALGFLAVLPLLWGLLRSGARDTAMVVLVLSGSAIWGALADIGPFAATQRNGSFLPVVAFLVSASAASLALSADISARIATAAKFHKFAAELRAMFRQAVVGIAQIDTAGRFLAVNDRYCEVVRRPAADLTQLRIQDIVASDDRERVLSLINRATSTGEGFVIEAKHLPSGGSQVWARIHVSTVVNEAGPVRYFTVVAEDISARRRAEEFLQRTHDDLLQTVQERIAALNKVREALHTGNEERKRLEAALKHDIAERRKAQGALIESERRFRTVIQGVSDTRSSFLTVTDT